MTDEGIPATWTRICGLSLDRDRVGAVWCAHDRMAKVISVYAEYSVALPALPILAEALNRYARNDEGTAPWIPVIMDGQGSGRSKVEGGTLMQRLAGLAVNLSDARFDEEAGIADVYKAIQTGKLFVEPTLRRWEAEFDTFARAEKEKGDLPEGFHLMRATALCLMVDPHEWISENRATSDREGYDRGDQTRSKVTGY